MNVMLSNILASMTTQRDAEQYYLFMIFAVSIFCFIINCSTFLLGIFKRVNGDFSLSLKLIDRLCATR